MSERRKRPETPEDGRSGEDRRVIERFSNPRIQSDLSQIFFWVRALATLIFVGAASRVAFSLYKGRVLEVAFESFFGVCMIIFSVLLFRYARSINNYLKNESIGNLEEAFENQHLFWKSLGIVMAIFVVVNFIFFI